MTRREFVMATCAGLTATSARADDRSSVGLGLLIYSYGRHARARKDEGFSDPVRFLRFAHERGANAVQVPLGIRSPQQAAAVRRAADKLDMQVEGIVSPPNEDRADAERLAAELAAARACGAEIVRTVMLGGRRYEVFAKPDDFPAFARRAEASLRRAEPLARAARVALAVENHKDYRVDEQVDLLTRLGSEWVGVCVDTGNNLALLEAPIATVEALAPFARTVHLKDIGLEEAADGFRMAEVPLGLGVLDLPRIVAVLRKANPRIRFQLEMITRDPLSIPCLTEKYWATLARVPGRDLARALAHVRASARKQPLPRVERLALDDQLAAEDRHVRESFAFAAKTRLISPG